MPDQVKPKKNYIRYTAEELAAVPSPYQMERELQQVCDEYGLGPVGYAAQRRLEAAAQRHHHHRL